MTKPTRFQRARFLADMGHVSVVDRDMRGRLKSAYVSGSGAKLYYVILRREDAGIEAECLLDTGAGNVPCQGGLRNICYHALAALIWSSAEWGAEVSVCRNERDAMRLSNTGGKVFQAWSRNGQGRVWLRVIEPERERVLA